MLIYMRGVLKFKGRITCNKMTGFKQGAADVAPLNLDIYMYDCEWSQQEKI